MRIVALIPARAGSKRVPGKNTRLLAGQPLIAYTIAAAQESGIFDGVIVCTDDKDAMAVADTMGASIYERDPVADEQADFEWVRGAMRWTGFTYNAFAILRPTSPFRTAVTIQRAYKQFQRDEAHSLRAVEAVTQHPGKMWWNNGPGYPMTPVCDAKRSDGTPWHSCPTQTLPPAYVQNASLEMAWTYVVNSFGTISGRKIAPFLTTWPEGFDINTEADWFEAENIAAMTPHALPKVEHAHHSEV